MVNGTRRIRLGLLNGPQTETEGTIPSSHPTPLELLIHGSSRHTEALPGTRNFRSVKGDLSTDFERVETEEVGIY